MKLLSLVLLGAFLSSTGSAGQVENPIQQKIKKGAAVISMNAELLLYSGIDRAEVSEICFNLGRLAYIARVDALGGSGAFYSDTYPEKIAAKMKEADHELGTAISELDYFCGPIKIFLDEKRTISALGNKTYLKEVLKQIMDAASKLNSAFLSEK